MLKEFKSGIGDEIFEHQIVAVLKYWSDRYKIEI
jgi:hypothetical protein